MAWFKRKRETAGIPTSTASSAVAKSANWEEKIIRPHGRTSLIIPAWYRGVSLLMQTMGQMVLQYQRLNGEGGNFTEEKFGQARRLNYLLQVRPNAFMTASQLQEQIEYRKIYYGNAYVYVERDDSAEINALWLCTSGGFNPLTNTYTITYNKPGGVQMRADEPAENVLHFKNVFLTEDGFLGVPTIDFAFKTLCIAATANEQTLKDMAKGGKYKILVQEAAPQAGQHGLLSYGRADQSEMKKITNQLAEDWSANDAVFLNNVADAKIISQTAAELRLLETRGFEVNDLARILGVPRIMMMEDAGSSYKMPEHATQEFMLRTIQPRIREWEDELNSKILSLSDFGRRRVHVCELALRRLDAKGQAEIDKLHMETGVKSPNELRNQYDLPAIPGGDTHYISTNLAEVGSEKLQREAPAKKVAAPRKKKGGE